MINPAWTWRLCARSKLRTDRLGERFASTQTQSVEINNPQTSINHRSAGF